MEQLKKIINMEDGLMEEKVSALCRAGLLVEALEHSKLYMLIGTKFGGDGKQKFKLPDLRQKSPENMMYCMAMEGEFPEVWR